MTSLKQLTIDLKVVLAILKAEDCSFQMGVEKTLQALTDQDLSTPDPTKVKEAHGLWRSMWGGMGSLTDFYVAS